MENFGHTNGNGHGEKSSESSSGLQHAIALAKEDINDDTHAISTQHSNFGSKARDIMERLELIAERVEQHFGSRIEEVQHRVTAVGEHSQQSQQQLNALQQEIQALQEFVRIFPQQIQELQAFVRSVPQQMQMSQQQIEDVQRTASDSAARLASLSGIVEQEAVRRSSIEVAIGELDRTLSALRTDELQILRREIETLKDTQFSAGKRQKMLAVAAGIALLLAGIASVYALPAVSQYVAAWVPWAI